MVWWWRHWNEGCVVRSFVDKNFWYPTGAPVGGRHRRECVIKLPPLTSLKEDAYVVRAVSDVADCEDKVVCGSRER